MESDVNGAKGANPGSNKAVHIGHLKGGDKVLSVLSLLPIFCVICRIYYFWGIFSIIKVVQVKGGAVESVTLEDLLTVTPSPTSTYIIKTDIEGYDCKVGTVKTFYKV